MTANFFSGRWTSGSKIIDAPKRSNPAGSRDEQKSKLKHKPPGIERTIVRQEKKERRKERTT